MTNINSAHIFSRFATFRRLQALELLLLAQFSQESEFQPGTVLAEWGEEDTDELFLLEGSVELLARDGGARIVAANSISASGPLSQLRPRHYRVAGVSKGRMLTVPYSLLMSLLESVKHSPYWVDSETLAQGDDESRLFAQVLQDLPRNNVRLPVTRSGAASIRSQLGNANCGLHGLAQAALVEPSVALRLIGAANHAAFFSTPVDSCFDAVARLGNATSRQLLQFFTSPENIPDRYAAITPEINEIVKRSREAAFLCAQLADLSESLLLARAYEIGLLHAVGELAAIAYAENMPELCLHPPRLESCRRNARHLLTTTLLREYGLSGEYVMAASCCNDWFRVSNSSIDYCDLLILAQWHAASGTARASQLPVLQAVTAFSRLPPGSLTPERSMSMLRQARTQADSARVPQWQAA